MKKLTKQQKYWVWGLVALIFVLWLVLLVGPAFLGARPLSPDQVVFAPVTNSYDAAVNAFRPSNLRNFRQAVLCGWFPSQPERLPWQWLVNLARGCS